MNGLTGMTKRKDLYIVYNWKKGTLFLAQAKNGTLLDTMMLLDDAGQPCAYAHICACEWYGKPTRKEIIEHALPTVYAVFRALGAGQIVRVIKEKKKSRKKAKTGLPVQRDLF